MNEEDIKQVDNEDKQDEIDSKIEERRRKGREAYHKNKNDPKYKEKARIARQKYYQKNKASIIKYQLDKRKSRHYNGTPEIPSGTFTVQHGEFVLTFNNW